MFVRNVVFACALCATSTVFAAPISGSTTISSATITSNTQVLSSTTTPAETPSASADEYSAWGLGPIFRDGKIVEDHRVPAPLGLVRPSTPRNVVG